MPFHRRHRSWIGFAPLALVVAMPLAGAGLSPAVTAPRADTAPRAGFAWSPAQVRELIAAIGEARRTRGLDPARYGAAALRAELDLCEQLWNTPGSRQLDTLASTAALALANDYRRGGGGRVAPVRREELATALVTGRLRPWLAGQDAARDAVPGRAL